MLEKFNNNLFNGPLSLRTRVSWYQKKYLLPILWALKRVFHCAENRD